MAPLLRRHDGLVERLRRGLVERHVEAKLERGDTVASSSAAMAMATGVTTMAME